MDATKLRVADTATLHLKDAAGNHLFHEGKPVQIVIYGPGSAAFAEIEGRQTNRVIKRMQDNDGKIATVAPAQRKAETAQDLAAMTVRFENLTYEDKQGPDLFEAVYSDPKLGFIPAQVQKFVADWGNFSAGSATS
jgi:hypothetical protein